MATEVTNFRKQASKLFLTYAQTDGEKEALLKFLETKLSIKGYIVCKEHHKEEGVHFHVYLELEKRCNITNSRYLDWEGHHPKIETAKSSLKCVKYCKKDGDFITNLKFGTFMRARDLAKEGNWKEALQLIIEEQPKEIRFLDKWEKNLKRVSQLYKIPYNKTKFERKDFKEIEVPWTPKSTKCLVISGASGIGKTQFAKTLLKNPLLVRHKDKLKQFDSTIHDGIIFDDMSFAHWPREACIHLLDTEEDSDLDVKCSMVTIPAGTPRIFTTNADAASIFNGIDAAIRRRYVSWKIICDMRKNPTKAVGGAAMLN